MNRHWSVSTFRHRSEDDKRQSARNGLWLMIYSLLSLSRTFLFVMKSEIIFRDFSHIWFRFLSYQSILAVSQLESELNQTIYSFESRFDQIRIASQSEQSRSSHTSQVVKLLKWRQILNHSSIDQKKNTNHNHKQKERRCEERIYDAKNNNLKKT
jgi:hypothetical protein